MSPRLRRVGLASALLALALVLLWPLPMVFTSHVLAAPDQEAAPHLWGLWAAWTTGQPLVLDTTLLSWPDGVTVVLVDPANLPWFGLGLPLGPAAAYNLTLLGGVLTMGLAGGLLAREAGGRPWLGATVAMACPTLLANAADGMTEGFGVGWVGVFLAMALRARREPGARAVIGAALALAAACYAGPYNGVWCALLGAAVGLRAMWDARGGAWRPLARLAVAAAAASALVLPLALAIQRHRPAHLPGSVARAGLPPRLDQPDIFRGGLRYGADLTDLALPALLTGHEAPVSHTAYLGLIALGLAGLAVARDWRRWPWLAGASAFAALSLGPRLYWGGVAVELADRGLLGPAGVAMLAVPALARLTRWYRAGAVATLLLAPLVSAAPRRGATAALAAALVVGDALLLAPLAWPLHHAPLPDAAPFAPLTQASEGALLELPPVTSATPPPGHWRDQLAVLQPLHGRPVGGSIMRLPVSPEARKAQAAVESWLRDGVLPAPTLARIRADGFRWLALYPAYRPMPDAARARLAACFGAPVAVTDDVWLFDLGVAPPDGCRATDGAGNPRQLR